MSNLDWIILIATLTGIIIYGMYKSRTTRNLDGYFLSNRSMPWYLVLLSIMGTQASAVTFISAPGQAYTDGMRFVQYYFGLPLAMIVICIFFVPVFRRLKVYTAYEFLENRFDVKTRTLTSALFLLSRGLSTGISIYAPSIILSSLLGWNIYYTNLVMGGLLIIYTMSGGAKAVAYTQQLQLIIIIGGMFVAGYLVVKLMPANIGFGDALKLAGGQGKMNIITTGVTNNHFDWKDKYNIWSGVIGGFFLALSYFGTDQSQVGRYLTAKSDKESKVGLLMNGMVKVPMQFLILLLGVLVFSFYQYHKAPVYFDDAKIIAAKKTNYKDTLVQLEQQYSAAIAGQNMTELNGLRAQYKTVLKKALPGDDANDTNYIFLRFVVDNLPKGLVGLLIAVIFLSAWGSIAAALNSLASCTVVDFHKKFINKDCTEAKDYNISRWYTFGWGVFSIIVAMFAYNLGNSLIEAVNILGSLFYGVILGIFLVAFWMKWVGGNAVFIAAVISEALIILVYNLNIVSFLWLNVVGALLVIILSVVLQPMLPDNKKVKNLS
ncbi:MAG: sodium:solute symporter [Ferruginibacter sp.]|uniref:sodium:solute symporter n=1 Tax=Ferruginibacter sp. TaxID=1940288 RepID=UPI00265AA937|nr:sodium:solute symporter [Ferruginibacter sp.]MDB5279773.1 sodium:solute symporter [Ferruginibacter sp.]